MHLNNKSKNIICIIIGIVLGWILSCLYNFFFQPSHATIKVGSKNAIMENGFCYFQPIEKNKITYDILNQQSLENQCCGQSHVDIGSFQDTDIQTKTLIQLHEELKTIQPEEFDENDIWVTSDIHGDVKMLLQGLLKSGLIIWDGSLKQEYFIAYKGRKMPIIYPDVKINNHFNGVYVNLGDIVNKNAFGMSCLYLLHDIYKKTKNANGQNNKVKILFGNHEYHDLLTSTTSAYTETIHRFIDMFEVVYEKDGLLFSHAPLEASLRPKNENERKYLQSIIATDDDKYTLKHVLYGTSGVGNFPTTATPGKPDTIISNSISGHTHGPIDFGYNKRNDVLNIATDRFAKDITKRGIIFKINKQKKIVSTYTQARNNKIVKTNVDKNLFD